MVPPRQLLCASNAVVAKLHSSLEPPNHGFTNLNPGAALIPESRPFEMPKYIKTNKKNIVSGGSHPPVTVRAVRICLQITLLLAASKTLFSPSQRFLEPSKPLFLSIQRLLEAPRALNQPPGHFVWRSTGSKNLQDQNFGRSGVSWSHSKTLFWLIRRCLELSRTSKYRLPSSGNPKGFQATFFNNSEPLHLSPKLPRALGRLREGFRACPLQALLNSPQAAGKPPGATPSHYDPHFSSPALDVCALLWQHPTRS